jgi:predicted GIY-YIG superfamily endonuclease
MVYLIHFDKPYRHAKHYIGHCEDGKLEQRLARHRKGDGAKLLAVIQKAGIGWKVVRIWPDGDRELERKLKNRAATDKCPVCDPTRALKRKNIIIYGHNLDHIG